MKHPNWTGLLQPEYRPLLFGGIHKWRRANLITFWPPLPPLSHPYALVSHFALLPSVPLFAWRHLWMVPFQLAYCKDNGETFLTATELFFFSFSIRHELLILQPSLGPVGLVDEPWQVRHWSSPPAQEAWRGGSCQSLGRPWNQAFQTFRRPSWIPWNPAERTLQTGPLPLLNRSQFLGGYGTHAHTRAYTSNRVFMFLFLLIKVLYAKYF